MHTVPDSCTPPWDASAACSSGMAQQSTILEMSGQASGTIISRVSSRVMTVSITGV